MKALGKPMIPTEQQEADAAVKAVHGPTWPKMSSEKLRCEWWAAPSARATAAELRPYMPLQGGGLSATQPKNIELHKHILESKSPA